MPDWTSRQENAITVVAAGEVRARANILHLVLEIRTRSLSAADALQENNSRDKIVRSRLRSVGIHEESIEASGITFLPAAGDGLTLPGTTEPQGFVAARTLSINVFIGDEDLNLLTERVARILDEALEGGAQAGARQQVNLAIFRSPCMTFALDSDENQRPEALRRAMVAARTAAEEMARSMGSELDDIIKTQVLELGALVQGRWAANAYGMPGLDMPRPSEAGRVTVRAVVSVTYRIRRAAPSLRERDRLERGHFTLEQADSTPTSHTDRAPELS